MILLGMTQIIIASTKVERERILLNHLNKILNKDISTLVDAIKFPDIHYLTTVSNSIGVDEVKDFVKEMRFKPFEEIYQVGIIDRADTLTTEAQNSLLKVLEDFKEDTVFILLTGREKMLLDTILSRGTKYYGSSSDETQQDGSDNTFLHMTTVDQLVHVEKLGKEKEREEIEMFLKSILRSYRHMLEKNLVENRKDKDLENNIKAVQEAVDGIKGNGNKKLVLFNMVVQMSKEI